MDATEPVAAEPAAETVQRLIKALVKDAGSLGKDDASRRVREAVSELEAAISSGRAVAGPLFALEDSVERLHMSYLRPFFKQTLRTLRTALDLDVAPTRKTSPWGAKS
jgi:hypothetical protein